MHNKLKGIQIPTEQQWGKISKLFNIKNNYNDLVKQYNKERYIFNLPIGITDVWEFKPDKARYGHKTQKPEDITDRIINASSNEEQLVYIPFAGSGSEIVSCIKNNRNYIATETNKEYINEIINKRIENTYKELNKEVC
ncbi:site-specific DNA-methyltransferase [Clostridium perfringens]|nr:site-specific DNA-methyltransferase [Clostridium perfringens]